MGYDSSLIIRGIREPDEEWNRMKAVWESCKTANVEVPGEVKKFFGYEAPSPEGVCVDIEKEVIDCEDENITTGVRDGGESGRYFLINVKKIPESVTHLKIYIEESY